VGLQILKDSNACPNPRESISPQVVSLPQPESWSSIMVQALKAAPLTREPQSVVAASIKEKEKRLVFVLKKGEKITLDALTGVVDSCACTFKNKYNNKILIFLLTQDVISLV
jgi:hypothetical protein